MTLSTREAADLLGVHASTVKRWFRAAPGLVATTAGGHRRIPLETALRVARDRGNALYLHGFEDEAPAVWNAVQALKSGRCSPSCRLLLRWLKRRRADLVGRFLRCATTRSPVAAFVLDGVFAGFMRRVGEEWRRGALDIADERAASREANEAALSLVERIVQPDDSVGSPRPVAVVGCVEGDRHTLGALLVRLFLAERGWAVEYLGGGVPASEVVATQRAARASLVCVSATGPAGPDDVRRFVEAAGRLADPERPFALAVGGRIGGSAGPSAPSWPHGAAAGFDDLSSFEHWLEKRVPRRAATVA